MKRILSLFLLFLVSFMIVGGCGEDGDDGQQIVFEILGIDPGTAPCDDTGGTLVTAGFDDDEDGNLDSDEIDDDLTFAICDGMEGIMGTDGNDAEPFVIMTTGATAAECPPGGEGSVLTIGLDGNGNGEFDSGEEISELMPIVICDGAPGTDGMDGESGMDGAPGMDGMDGEPGMDGAPGMDGTDGAPGMDGMPGPGGEFNCSDGETNDEDMLIDCADPDCDMVVVPNFNDDPPTFTFCTTDNSAQNESPSDFSDATRQMLCTDKFDNDGDGSADCGDNDCNPPAGDDDDDGLTAFNALDGVPCESGQEVTCDDDFDNDGDEFQDCEDTDCDFQSGCEGSSAGDCTDDQDNDMDGTTDCEDRGCNGQLGPNGETCEQPREATCDDGEDNDADGATDVADTDCDLDPAAEGGNMGGACDDMIDNDGDGGIDCADGGCSNDPACFGGDGDGDG